MAPLAAKWGRLWRALLGQARTGHEAPDVPTSPSPARLACPHGPDRPPSAGGSPALRSSGLRQGPPRGREGTRLRAPCVSRAPEGPPRQLPNRREPPREAGQLTGGGPVHGWQLRLLLRLEDAATRRQVSQQHVSGWHPERETQTPRGGQGAIRAKQPLLGRNSDPPLPAAHMEPLGSAFTELALSPPS